MPSSLVHPNAPVLPPPFKVNAFIRFCRYAALGTGIIWGMMRYAQIRRKHERNAPIEHDKFVKHYWEAVAKHKQDGIDNAIALARQVGQPDDTFLPKQKKS